MENNSCNYEGSIEGLLLEDIKTYDELVDTAIDAAIGLCDDEEVCEGEIMRDDNVRNCGDETIGDENENCEIEMVKDEVENEDNWRGEIVGGKRS